MNPIVSYTQSVIGLALERGVYDPVTGSLIHDLFLDPPPRSYDANNEQRFVEALNLITLALVNGTIHDALSEQILAHATIGADGVAEFGSLEQLDDQLVLQASQRCATALQTVPRQ